MDEPIRDLSDSLKWEWWKYDKGVQALKNGGVFVCLVTQPGDFEPSSGTIAILTEQEVRQELVHLEMRITNLYNQIDVERRRLSSLITPMLPIETPRDIVDLISRFFGTNGY